MLFSSVQSADAQEVTTTPGPPTNGLYVNTNVPLGYTAPTQADLDAFSNGVQHAAQQAEADWNASPSEADDVTHCQAGTGGSGEPACVNVPDADDRKVFVNEAVSDYMTSNPITGPVGGDCAQQLEGIIAGLDFTSTGLSLASNISGLLGAILLPPVGPILEIVSASGAITSDAVAAASTGVGVYQSGLPSCSQDFTGTIRGYANITAGQGVSAFDGAITLGNENGLSYYKGITLGGGSLAGAGTDGDDATTADVNAIAIGNGAHAENANDTALGTNASATGGNATAIGANSTASGENSTAVGADSTASNVDATAVGARSTASGKNSTALGADSTASEEDATAVGFDSNAGGEDASAFGANSNADGKNSTAIGSTSTASAEDATAVGANSNAGGANDTALGSGSDTGTGGNNSVLGANSKINSGSYNTAVGVGHEITGSNNTAIGDPLIIDGNANFVAGNDSDVHGNDNIAIGNSNNLGTAAAPIHGNLVVGDNNSGVATDNNNVIGDGNSVTTGTHNNVLGDDVTVDAAASIAIGQQVTVGSDNGISIGTMASVGDDATSALAIGAGAKSNAVDAISLGSSAETSGEKSIAIGSGSRAKSNGSISTGVLSSVGTNSDNSAVYGAGASVSDNAPNATAIGGGSQVNAADGTAIGGRAKVNAANGTAVGVDAQANAEGSAAFGNGAVANLNNQQVFGTASNTYTTPGITSSLSKSRQSGPLEVLTTDTFGNLASDGGMIFTALAELQAGVAIAMAADAPTLNPGKEFALRMGYGNFNGEANAIALSAAGLVCNDCFMRGDTVTVDAAVGAGWANFATYNADAIYSAKAGVQISW